MEDQSNDQFKRLVATSPFLQERWEAAVSKVQADAVRLYGVELAPDDVAHLVEVKIHALGNQPMDSEAYERELHSHPKFREVNQLRLVAAGDQEARARSVEAVLNMAGSRVHTQSSH